ncbi:MAG: class I SAM-dependent methyltransferase [Candidatus Thermoplasmatota archaeon]|nr:class I SAM-dependent methyltransferase [Candidatus Thermoplasmatota archaeon]
MNAKGEGLIESHDHLSVILGKERVDLAFGSEDNWLYLISTGSDARWPSQLLRTGIVSLRIHGNTVKGYASLITSENEKRRVREIFLEKYGSSYFNRYFTNPGRYLRVNISEDSQYRPKTYYEWLQEEFDAESANYDQHIYGNRINRLLRERSLETIFRFLKPPASVLEIGCGSGTETLEVLKNGNRVTAIDVSEGMLSIVREKANEFLLNDNLTTMKLRASQISEVLDRFGPESFDLVYSTFGALNCEPDIELIPPVLEKLLKKGGHFIAGVYNKFCISELVIQFCLLRIGSLSWRFKNPIPEGHSRFCVDVYSFTPGEFNSLFRKYLRMVSLTGVPVLIPPSNFRRFISITGEKFDSINRIDRKLAGIWPLNRLGDHFLAVYKKV